MNIKTIIPLIVLAVLIQSCDQVPDIKPSSYKKDRVDYETIPVTRQAKTTEKLNPPPLKRQEEIKKKIIKDGRMGLKVDSLENSKAQIDSLVKFYRGYYATENLTKTKREATYDLRIRIPNENFERFLSGVERAEARILYKEINARDVTEQFIDLETRLKNKRNYLARYNQLLHKANTVKEILEIEEKIRGLEEEIESTTGRLRYLSNKVAYSTLRLELVKAIKIKSKPVEKDKFTEQFVDSVSKGWYGFVDFVLFLFRIWPLWIVVGAVIFIWRRIRKRRK
ncbi:DUF4349 domain-containing protein [Marinilabilia rubra]|uniref:DUF4349 domain-containing protein n=1 Tax=Marinilabilia rubra TaxID=2162893 RepID=A0A2U2BC98_9BACT|nr:DUF4349 domain-containing protein [Marinilabilia rubra]PWE00689.1 DUF4349 domain-containing protein [Marinilabilia rubra]